MRYRGQAENKKSMFLTSRCEVMLDDITKTRLGIATAFGRFGSTP